MMEEQDSIAGPSNSKELSRSYLFQQSKRKDGFGNEQKRRKAWLCLLDLSDCEKGLIVQTNTNFEEKNGGLPRDGDDQTDDIIPIDNEGWQIASHHLEEGSYDEEKGARGNLALGDDANGQDGWDVAKSKRTRRRRRQNDEDDERSTGRGTTSTSLSRSETMTTNTPENISRDPSVSGFAKIDHSSLLEQNGGEKDSKIEDRETLKAQRKARKRLKMKQAKRARGDSIGQGDDEEDDGEKHPQNDLGASIVHVQRSDRSNENGKNDDGGGNDDMKKHKDEDQVALDIRRSFIASGDTQLRVVRRKELSSVINGVLRKHPSLNYYQGYHDVIGVLLIVMISHHDGDNGEEVQVADQEALDAVIEVASRLSLHFLRDAMTENMTPILGHLKVLRDILRQSKLEDLGQKIEQASPLPYLALPWLLSIFAHDVQFSIACLIFDYVLTRGPKSILYLSAALIEQFHEKIDSSDPAEMHHELSKLPEYMTSENLPLIFEEADELASRNKLDVSSQVMGLKSVLYTWSTLPFDNHEEPNQVFSRSVVEWQKADVEADETLRGDCKEIVLNALPTPPVSESGEEGADAHIKDDKSLVSRKWWKTNTKGEKRLKRSMDKFDKNKQILKNSATMFALGAFGAMGAAALILLYGGATGASGNFPLENTLGLGSAFPAGLRFAEPFRVILRNALHR